MGRVRKSVTLAALVAMMLAIAGCDSSDVATVSTEREANEILVRLAHKDVHTAVVEKQTAQRAMSYVIRVSPTEADRAREVLLYYNLPRDAKPGRSDVVGEDSLLASESQQQLRHLYVLSGELERTFELIDGVTEARVHINLPQSAGISLSMPGAASTPAHATAAVLVKYDPERFTAVTGELGLQRRDGTSTATPSLDRPMVMNILRRAISVPDGTQMDDGDVSVIFDPALIEIRGASAAPHPLDRMPGGKNGVMILLLVLVAAVCGLSGSWIWALYRPKSQPPVRTPALA